MAGEKLLGVINSIRNEDKNDTTDLLFGVVTSIQPLKIKIDNRYEVDEKFLILSCLCKETIIEITEHSHNITARNTEVSDSHDHVVPSTVTQTSQPTIRLWRGLKVGDKVRMLRINKGQAFYVIEREEGVIS